MVLLFALHYILLEYWPVLVYFVSAVGIQMKLEFFQRKFWTACRQVTTYMLLLWNKQQQKKQDFWIILLCCCVQCTALDGKCSISCDNEVKKKKDIHWRNAKRVFAHMCTFISHFCRISTVISLTTMASFLSQRSHLRYGVLDVLGLQQQTITVSVKHITVWILTSFEKKEQKKLLLIQCSFMWKVARNHIMSQL